MVDKPINLAPSETDAVFSFYGRKNNVTNDLVQYPEDEVAHAVGKTASDKGEVPYVDANGKIAWAAAGTNRQVLAYDVNGIPGPTDAPQTYRYLSTGTAAAAASIEFTSGFSTTFDEYVFQIIDLYPATDATTLQCQISENGGSSYLATNYQFQQIQASTGAMSGNSQLTNTFWALLTNMDNASTSGAFGTVRLMQNTTKTAIHSAVWGLNSTVAQMQLYELGGQRATTSRANAIKFYMSSGNLTATIHMYGVTKS